MKKAYLLIAGAALIATPVLAQTTMSPGSSSATTTTTTITSEDAGKVRQYITRERTPSVTVREEVRVGASLPESVEIRSFPAEVGVSKYRYTVVNGRTVLVEPGSRRIVQIVE
jgi:hypothetical protein